jgi:diaminopimelate decarboxylase
MEVSIRWNPGFGAGFCGSTITAGKESHGRPIKFGVEEAKVLDVCQMAKNYGKRVVGLHQHIGSGWKGEDVYMFLETVNRTVEMARVIEDQNDELRFIDFGGGPGIPYQEGEPEFPIDVYAEGICNEVKNSGLGIETIYVEPGRYVVGDAGILLTEVNTVEEKNGNLIIGVDAGFHTLVRPAFYGEEDKDGNFVPCYHEITSCVRGYDKGVVTVVGLLCETGDVLAIKREMEIPNEGDVLAVLNAGAYGHVMASNYNSWPLPAEVMIKDGNLALIREHQTFEHFMATVPKRILL